MSGPVWDDGPGPDLQRLTADVGADVCVVGLGGSGLAAALEALAARAALPVEIVATPSERLPDAVEATAYYIVAEALTNVAKYADASVATVAVTRTNGRLRVEVRDDGIGGADIGRGSGLRGLTDRVEALNGTLRIDSRPGTGTVVAAAIPVPASSSPL